MNERTVLGGRYELIEVIGRGGMAEVWRATDTRLGRPVAVKRLRADLATDPTFQARFNREAQSAAGLNHPNIVSVYDTGAQDDPVTGVQVPYIVMELVEGKTLRDLLRADGPIEPETALRYTSGVLDALAYSHANGIIHRDIKPANVMLTDGGHVKVMDFGIARAVADTSATMTQTAAIIGTAQYLSPEQARGETVDARSDIYSTGCLLYELLTGRPPFVGDSPVSVAYQHVREIPTPPSQVVLEDGSRVPGITPTMDTVVLKALAKSPDDRYQNAREMRFDCIQAINGGEITAELPTVVAAPATPAEPTQVLPTQTEQLPARAMQPEEAALVPDDYGFIDNYYTDDDEDEEPKRRRPGAATIVLVTLLAVLLATLGVLVWRVTRDDPTTNKAEVPAVRGYQEEAAKSQLTNAKLVAKVAQTQGPAETKGQVIAQDPEGGTKVDVGSTVTITINTGPPMGQVPAGLVGKTETEARKILTDAGFTNISTLSAPAGIEKPEHKAGQVLDVQPNAGTPVASDTRITLYIATGKSTLPDVKGTQVEAARSALTQAGFTNIFESTQETTEQPAGTVISQKPDGGQVLDRGMQIVIVIAKAPTAPTTITVEPTPEPTQTPSQQVNEVTVTPTPTKTKSNNGGGNGTPGGG